MEPEVVHGNEADCQPGVWAWSRKPVTAPRSRDAGCRHDASRLGHSPHL